MKHILLVAMLFSSVLLAAQSTMAPSTPGQISSLTVSWTEATPNCSSFNLYRGAKAGSEDYTKPLVTVSGAASKWTDSSVLPGSSYYYTVTAVAGGMESAPSNEVSAQAPVPPSPPVAKIAAP